MAILKKKKTEEKADLRVVQPAVDILHENDKVVLVAEIPGVPRDQIDIQLEENVLTIEGAVQGEQREGYDLIHAEFAPVRYQRSFTVSRAIDIEGIKADVHNGVLKVTLPKVTKGVQKIEVKAN